MQSTAFLILGRHRAIPLLLMTLGADGAVLGTRLWASEEALGSSAYKNALTSAGSCDDVVRTQVFDTIWNSRRETKWPYPYDSSGTLRNTTTDAWDTSILALKAELDSNCLSVASDRSNDNKNLVDELNHAEEAKLPNAGFVCIYIIAGDMVWVR